MKKPTSDFTHAVWSATQKIPRGRVTTYGYIAQYLKKPRAGRAVGSALSKNRSKDVPCHRVVRNDGGLGGYAWGIETKIKRLQSEGILIKNQKVEREFILYKLL